MLLTATWLRLTLLAAMYASCPLRAGPCPCSLAIAPKLRNANTIATAAPTIASVENFIAIYVFCRDALRRNSFQPPPELKEAMLYTRNGSCFRWVARISDRHTELNRFFISDRSSQLIVLYAFRVSAAFENPSDRGAEFSGKTPCAPNPVMKGS